MMMSEGAILPRDFVVFFLYEFSRMSNCYLLIWIFYSYLCRSSKSIDRIDVIRHTASHSNRPILHDFTGGQLEQALDEAAFDDNDNDQDEEERSIDQNSLEEELREASRDDAQVPSSLSNSLFASPEMDDFENLMLSLRITSDDRSSLEKLALNRVADGEIPPGIDIHDYSDDDADTLLQLYQSDRREDRKALFEFIVGHTHNKLLNCAINLGRWMKNRRFDEPIFYRNCVPCTNTVDLNLQSLFNDYLHLQKLKHYFVNTCDMGQKWISYASDMEYVSIDLKRHPTATFTDVIRRNLLPNYRF